MGVTFEDSAYSFTLKSAAFTHTVITTYELKSVKSSFVKIIIME